MNKDIIYNRKRREWDAYLNGEYIGSFDTAHEALNELDRLAYEQLTHGVA